MPYYEGNENVIIYMSTIGMPYMYEDNRLPYLNVDDRNFIIYMRTKEMP